MIVTMVKCKMRFEQKKVGRAAQAGRCGPAAEAGASKHRSAPRSSRFVTVVVGFQFSFGPEFVDERRVGAIACGRGRGRQERERKTTGSSSIGIAPTTLLAW